MNVFKVITYKGNIHFVIAENVLKAFEMFHSNRGLVITAI